MENEKNNSTDANHGDCNESEAIKIIEDAVNKLYEYQECYFEHYKLEQASLRNNKVKELQEQTLKLLEKNKEAAVQCSRAKYFYQLGRVHNIFTSYSLYAEESLAKAVKLDPCLVPAWNDLGECYWKRDNIQEAKNCFENALSQSQNKVSLRNLSMVARQEASTISNNEQKVNNVEKGVDLARQAVQLDTSDGISWSILGNAYLAAFFTIQQNPRTLKQAMSAYVQAEKDPAAKNNPDLHYNKAVAHKYEEEYEEALQSFNRAIERDPTWEGSTNKQQQLLAYLDNVCEMIRTKGRLKSKKINSLVKSIDNKHLGPYDGGSYTAASGQTCKLQQLQLSQLVDGVNSEKVIVGKVICSVRDDDSVPFTFCLMDKDETVIAVTLYNLARGKGVIIGDSVAIPEPYFTRFQFTFSNKVFKFNSIRVDSPLVLVVNGRKLGRNNQASTQLSTFKMPH